MYHGRVKLPDDFYTFNFASICGHFTEHVGYDGYVGGTNIQEVPYVETPANVDLCAPATVNCSVCNQIHVTILQHVQTIHVLLHALLTLFQMHIIRLAPYGDTCTRPRVFMNCKGDKYELIQVISNPGSTRVYTELIPLRMKASQEIECDCPNLYWNAPNEGWIKGGFLFTTFQTGKVYLNYQGQMEDEMVTY
jgi:hypothetical protein